MAGGAFLRAPTSFPFSCHRPGGAIRVVPTGPNFDVRPGGVICAASVDLPLGVSLSGCYSAALASVAPALRLSSLLGLLRPSSHHFLELRSLRHNVHDELGLRCRVARAPVLRALVGASRAASLAMAPELVIGEEALKSVGLGGQLNECEG